MDFHVPKELMYFSLYFTFGAENEENNQRNGRNRIENVYLCGCKVKQLSLPADLADVIGDSAVVDDVQSIFVCVVVALGKLKGFLVTQLKA